MLDALDQPGRRALLAHEHAHLRGRHFLKWPASGLSLLLLDLYGKNGREEKAEQIE